LRNVLTTDQARGEKEEGIVGGEEVKSISTRTKRRTGNYESGSERGTSERGEKGKEET